MTLVATESGATGAVVAACGQLMPGVDEGLIVQPNCVADACKEEVKWTTLHLSNTFFHVYSYSLSCDTDARRKDRHESFRVFVIIEVGVVLMFKQAIGSALERLWSWNPKDEAM